MSFAARLILASGSPRRRLFLEELGFRFDVIVSGIDESQVAGVSPRAAAIQLAFLKASDVAARVEPGVVVVGADTVVALGETIFGKPSNTAEARAMLSALRGRTHRVITGVAVARSGGGCQVDAAETAVTMRDFSDREMDDYIDSGEPMDKAGAYAIQGLGAALVEGHSGCWCNVVGLPLVHMLRLLEAEGDVSGHPVKCDCAPWRYRIPTA